MSKLYCILGALRVSRQGDYHLPDMADVFGKLLFLRKAGVLENTDPTPVPFGSERELRLAGRKIDVARMKT